MVHQIDIFHHQELHNASYYQNPPEWTPSRIKSIEKLFDFLPKGDTFSDNHFVIYVYFYLYRYFYTICKHLIHNIMH